MYGFPKIIVDLNYTVIYYILVCMNSVILFNEKEFTKKYITYPMKKKKTFNKNSENFIVVNKTFFYDVYEFK